MVLRSNLEPQKAIYMIVELPVPHQNGATHIHIELVNYKQGYAVFGYGDAAGEFANSRGSKIVPGLILDANTGSLIAQAVSAIEPETIIEE